MKFWPLSWLKTMVYNRIILETDAQQVSLAFKSSDMNLSYFDVIIDDCKILSKNLGNCTLAFVKRSAN